MEPVEDKQKETIVDKQQVKKNPKKRRSYCQRFRESWRKRSLLKGWIDPPKTPGSTGHCKICKIDLKGSRTLLERHHKTNKHKKNLIAQGYSVNEPMQDEESDENEDMYAYENDEVICNLFLFNLIVFFVLNLHRLLCTVFSCYQVLLKCFLICIILEH